MKRLLLFGLILFPSWMLAQNYSNHTQLSQRVQNLARQYPNLAKATSLTKTLGQKDVWLLTLGSGNTSQNPALAVIGGADGSHLIGVEVAIGFAEKLLASANTDSVKTLLANHTFYVFPNVSPDASEQYFATPRFSRSGNARDTDDDRDGKANEDGFDDLDGNGVITMMRVQDATGRFKLHESDNRLVVAADASKNEAGGWLYLSEGKDNDKDGKFNEDGVGGVSFNKNLTFNYQNFTPQAGEHTVSENETRAVLDFLYEAFNVYAVLSFSPNNNLSSPINFNPAAVSKRVITGYYEPDAKVNALVSDLYNKITATKDAPKTQPSGGDLMSWAYFHYGRFSFSTPTWWIPKADAATKTPDDVVAQYLAFAKAQNIANTFFDWKNISHPDFPNQKVEIGGVDPFALNNPPSTMMDGIVSKHAAFAVKLASLRPQIDVVNVKKESVGNGITRITATVLNKGAMPTHTKIGEQTVWTKRIVVKLNATGNQSIVSGRPTQQINNLEGFASREFTWLVKGSGNITLEAGSLSAGVKKVTIGL